MKINDADLTVKLRGLPAKGRARLADHLGRPGRDGDSRIKQLLSRITRNLIRGSAIPLSRRT